MVALERIEANVEKIAAVLGPSYLLDEPWGRDISSWAVGWLLWAMAWLLGVAIFLGSIWCFAWFLVWILGVLSEALNDAQGRLFRKWEAKRKKEAVAEFDIEKLAGDVLARVPNNAACLQFGVLPAEQLSWLTNHLHSFARENDCNEQWVCMIEKRVSKEVLSILSEKGGEET